PVSQLNADLGSLAYKAGSTAGSDTISWSVVDQFSLTAAASTAVTVTSAPPPPPPQIGPDQLVLLLSEDRFGGDAQFIAKVDGVQIAGPTAVTTLHSSGQSETFNYTGMWPAGAHDLEI